MSIKSQIICDACGKAEDSENFLELKGIILSGDGDIVTEVNDHVCQDCYKPFGMAATSSNLKLEEDLRAKGFKLLGDNDDCEKVVPFCLTGEISKSNSSDDYSELVPDYVHENKDSEAGTIHAVEMNYDRKNILIALKVL